MRRMQFYYRIAGVIIIGEIPYDFVVQEESIPFLTEMQTDMRSDELLKQESSDIVEIEFVRKQSLSLPCVGGTWKMNRLYSRIGETERVFYCLAIGRQPYAIVCREARRIRIEYNESSIPYINYSHNLIDLISLETLLLEHKGLIIHSSFICWRSVGIIFTAPSGTGKSTQADLWTKYEQAECMNGDRTGLRKVGSKWMAYGLPYAGSSGIYRNESAPLAAIVILRQGKENLVTKMKPADAFRSIYPETLIHQWDSLYVSIATGYISELVTDVPCYLLSCRPDEEAVRVLKEQLELILGCGDSVS